MYKGLNGRCAVSIQSNRRPEAGIGQRANLIRLTKDQTVGR